MRPDGDSLTEDGPVRAAWTGLRVLAEVGMVTTGPVGSRRHVVSDTWREIERLRAIETAALQLLNALAVDEEWDHLIVEQRTIDAVSALSAAVRR
jgi:hypothetical protein